MTMLSCGDVSNKILSLWELLTPFHIIHNHGLNSNGTNSDDFMPITVVDPGFPRGYANLLIDQIFPEN